MNFLPSCLLYTASFLKHPRTPTGVTGMDYQSADSEHLIKRIRTGPADEVWRGNFYFSSSAVMFVTCISTTDLRFPCNPLIKTRRKKSYAHHVLAGVLFWCDA